MAERFSRHLRRVRVFVSSPGDVADERARARAVVQRLGLDPAFREKPAFTYPYEIDDTAREDLAAPDEIRRVVRGGSFDLFDLNARAANRDWYLPNFRYGVIGFRLVVSRSRS